MAVEQWREYEDAELVVEALLGKGTAFDELVFRYRPAVLAAVLRQVPSRAVAEEVCQEALVRAFKALPMLRDPMRFPAWLHSIARREVIRQGPSESREASHAPLDEEALDRGASGGHGEWEALERRLEAERVRQAMAALPDEFQLVLTLYYWAEMPLERISAFIGRPVSTVKWRLHRARALMRARLAVAMAEETEETWRNDDERRTERAVSRSAAHGAHAGQGGCVGSRG